MTDTVHQILRARSPRSAPVPTNLYWNDTARQWGRFDEATRHSTPLAVNPPPPDAGADLAWMPDLPRDLDGYPYIETRETGLWRVTLCCAAMPGIDDGPLYCKSCITEIEVAVDTPARLDGNWDPGNGPIRVELP